MAFEVIREADNVLVVAVYVVVLDAVSLSVIYPRLTGMDFAYVDAIGDTDYVLENMRDTLASTDQTTAAIDSKS